MEYTPSTEFLALTAFTAGTKEFYWEFKSPKILRSAVTVVWIPTAVHRVMIRFHYYTDPPGSPPVFTDLGEVVPVPTGGPVPSGVEITTALRQLAADRRTGYIGAYYKGDGIAPLRLYETRITTIFQLGYYGDEP